MHRRTPVLTQNAEVMIEGLGLGDFFDVVVIGAECIRAKPYPDPYVTAMRYLGVQPDECVVIEDSPAGIHPSLCCFVLLFANRHPSLGRFVAGTGGDECDHKASTRVRSQLWW